jgi:acetyl esterase/lipase
MAGFRSRVTPADAPDGTPPLRLLVGDEDTARGPGQEMLDALVEAGMDATFEAFPGVDHGEIVDPSSSVPTVERLVELVATLGE